MASIQQPQTLDKDKDETARAVGAPVAVDAR
jgi:hypothetical protein